MSYSLRIATIFSILSLAGCAFSGFPDPPRATSVVEKDPASLIELKTLQKYQSLTDPSLRKLFRNETIDERILELDHQFYEFENNLWKQGFGIGTATDWVLLAISGVTATTGGASVKAALGAASAGIIGARGALDKNAFMDQSLPAVMAGMVAARETIRANIERNKQLSDEQYTLFAAAIDLRKFEQVGSIPGAIQAIAIDAGNKAALANETITEIRTIQFSNDEAAKLLRSFWTPRGEVDKKNEEQLLNWMDAHGLRTEPGDISTFLQEKSLADLRAQAVQKLINKQ